MTTRRAACSCGRLHLTIEGEPSRISMCHCLECQRRTGAAISNQARFRREQVTFAGEARAWRRTAGPHDCNSASELLRVNDGRATIHMKSPGQRGPGPS